MNTLNDFHCFNMDESLADVREAEAILKRCKLNELRALAVKYWKITPTEAMSFKKPELVKELATESAEEVIRDHWKAIRQIKRGL